MQTRWLVVAAAVVAVVAVVAMRGCGTAPGTGRAAGADGGAEIAAPASGVPGAEPGAEASRQALASRRAAAYRAAVSTVQRYLAALGEDVARADAFWAGGAPPAASGEADLRALRDVTSLRIENGTPVALDSSAVPDALEVPVDLRVSLKGSPLRRYQGWYRLRRAIDGERWEITSAAIDAGTPGR